MTLGLGYPAEFKGAICENWSPVEVLLHTSS